MAGPRRDPMMEIEQRKHQLKVASALQKQQLQMAEMQHQQQVEQFRLQAEAATKGQELQLKAAQDQIRMREQAQKRAQAGQAQAQARTQEQLDEPILGPPQQVDMMRPQPGMETMPQVGPSQLAAIGGGGAQQMGDGTAPMLTSTQTTESAARTPYGFAPVTTRRTLSQPNVMSAYESARIGLDRNKAMAEQQTAYFDDLARSAIFLGPKHPLVAQEVAKLDGQGQLLFRQSLMRQSGKTEEKSQFQPKQALDDRGKEVWMGGLDALGRETGALQRAAAGAPKITNVVENLMPTGPTKNLLQEQLVGATSALDLLNGIEQNFDPKFFTTPEQIRQWMFDKGRRLGFPMGSVSESTSYKDLMAQVSAFTAEKLHEVAGATLTNTELALNRDWLLFKTDDPVSLAAKVKAAKSLFTAVSIRNRMLLVGGFGQRYEDIDTALADHPELRMGRVSQDKPSVGEQTIYRKLDQETLELANTIQATNPGTSSRDAQRQAAQQVRERYKIGGF